MIHWQKFLPIFFILIGIGLITITVAADFVGLGDPGGFGHRQIMLTSVGLVLMLSGVRLATPAGQRFLQGLVPFIINEHPIQHRYEHPVTYLLLAVWFGLLTGLMEGISQGFRIYYLNKTVLLSQDYIWMVLLAKLTLFMIPGIILFLVAWQWPKQVTLLMTTFVLTFLNFLSLLFFFQLNIYAKLLLAVGLAAQISRLIAAHPSGFYAFVHYTAFGWIRISNDRHEQNDRQEMNNSTGEESLNRRQFLLSAGATVTGLALGVQGWQELVERNAMAELPPALPNRPNVLLIVLDTVRARSLSLHGYNRPTTPFLERLAATGVRFERAFSTAPWTLPSHASMFTGLLPYQLFKNWYDPLDSTFPTLAEVLRKHGYLTAGFIANRHYCSRVHGLNRGFIHYEDYLTSPGEIMRSSWIVRKVIDENEKFRQAIGYHQKLGRKTASMLSCDFLQWLSQIDQRRPFFAFLNFFDAHAPYLPPTEFALKFSPKQPRGHLDLIENLSDQDIRELNDAYDGCIAHLDYQLELLFANLQQQGLLQNTLIIVTSDHGEQFGEHGLMGHINSLYLATLHVPLLILFPSQIPTDINITQPVSLRDIPATVIDLIGLKEQAHFPGNSLAQFWDGRYVSNDPVATPLLSELSFDVFQEHYPIAKGDMKSLVFDRYHYIKNGDGSEELYDFENDPLERNNIASSQKGRPLVEQFKAYLQEITA